MGSMRKGICRNLAPNKASCASGSFLSTAGKVLGFTLEDRPPRALSQKLTPLELSLYLFRLESADPLRTFRYPGKLDHSPWLCSGNGSAVVEPVHTYSVCLQQRAAREWPTQFPFFHLSCGLRVKVAGTPKCDEYTLLPGYLCA